MERFSHPVYVLLHNRPSYARLTLLSLKNQTVRPTEKKITIIVDGFRGSKSQSKGAPNRTFLVALMSKIYFPRAKVVLRNRNLGIAKAWLFAERMFMGESDQWGFFIEEDYVLGANHLYNLSAMISRFQKNPIVAVVSATGDKGTLWSQSSFSHPSLGHQWAWAIRRSHVCERMQLMLEYEKLLGELPYRNRPKDQLRKWLEGLGLRPTYTSQDEVKKYLTYFLGRVMVTSVGCFGYSIGKHGEHANPEKFERTGKGKLPKELDEILHIESAKSESEEILSSRRALLEAQSKMKQ